MKEIVIRMAKVEEAPMIAQVLCMALGGTESHPMFPVFLELAGKECSQYSYRNTMVAEVEGHFVGAVVGYDGGKLHELRTPIFALMQKHLGKIWEIEDETAVGEFYLDSIAVFPAYRGCGIGRKLLEHRIQQAFDEGYEKVGLLVDKENLRAEALYCSLGFKRINSTTFLGHPMWHLQVIASKYKAD